MENEMSHKTILKIIAAFGILLTFDSQLEAQIRFSTDKPTRATVDFRSQRQKSAQPKSNRQVNNQAFIDQFNAIQRRKQAAEATRKEQQRRQQIRGRIVDPRIVRGAIQQQGLGISGGQSPATFGSSVFGPAVISRDNRSRVAGANPTTVQQKPVTQRLSVVIKNPFFINPNETQTVLKPMEESTELPMVEPQTFETTPNSLHGIPTKHIRSPIETPVPKSVIEPIVPPIKSTSYSNITSESLSESTAVNATFEVNVPEDTALENTIIENNNYVPTQEAFVPSAIEFQPVSWPQTYNWTRNLQGLGPVYGRPVYENGVYFPGW